DGPALTQRARRYGVDLDEATAGRLCAGILEFADSPEGLAVRVGCDRSAVAYRSAWRRLACRVPGVGLPVAEAFVECVVGPVRWLPYEDSPAALLAAQEAGLRVAVVSNCGWDLRTAFTRYGLAGLVDGYVAA